MKFQISIAEKTFNIFVSKKDGKLTFTINQKLLNVDIKKISKGFYSVLIDNISYIISIHSFENDYKIIINDNCYHMNLKDDSQLLLEKFGFKTNNKEMPKGDIYSQIPGLISKIFVNEKEIVKKGEKLFILEAMKMENEIVSPTKGYLDEILVKEGEIVEKGALIMKISKND